MAEFDWDGVVLGRLWLKCSSVSTLFQNYKCVLQDNGQNKVQIPLLAVNSAEIIPLAV